MQVITFKAKNKLSELLDPVYRGEAERELAELAAARIRARAVQANGKFDWEAMKRDRDRGWR
jgi:hypothetical protein